MQSSGSEGQTYFDRAKNCATKIISRKIFSSPTDEVGVILFGCKESSNALNSSGLGFEGIVEMGSLEVPTWEMLRKLQKVEANKGSNVDWIDGLLVALDFARNETA